MNRDLPVVPPLRDRPIIGLQRLAYGSASPAYGSASPAYGSAKLVLHASKAVAHEFETGLSAHRPSTHLDPVTTQPSVPDFSRGVRSETHPPVLPVVAQDADDDRVLMLAWMDEVAFRETLANGYAVYFSRSRGQLWRKGETSGHRQKVVEIRIDCDADAILLRVEQTGAACHEGYQSCFFRAVDADGRASVKDERLVDPDQVYGRKS